VTCILSPSCIREPGTLDGGDILKVGSHVYVGMGGRSNAEGSRGPSVLLALFPSCHAFAGIGQLRKIIEPLGYTVSVVCMNKALHLKSAVTALPDGTIIGHLPSLDVDHPFLEIVPTPGDEVNGAHVV
jgi:dimethylargininase